MQSRKTIIFTTLLIYLLASCSTVKAEIVINEIHPNPKGKDQGREWIELHNSTNTEVWLGHYQLESSQQTLPLEDKNIPAQGYQSFPIKLKNSNETIKLKQNEQILEEITYSTAPEGLSYSLENESYNWITPSKNLSNPITKTLEGKIIANSKDQIIVENNEKQVTIDTQSELNEKILEFIKTAPKIKFEVQETFNTNGKQQIQRSYQLKSIEVENKNLKQNEQTESFLLEIISLSALLCFILATTLH